MLRLYHKRTGLTATHLLLFINRYENFAEKTFWIRRISAAAKRNY
ncbi:MAG: hypothetical protein QG607_67 [Patescibacteria group bacterium]|nr:hypothetical protein [Patescibacteria group bacterium]